MPRPQVVVFQLPLTIVVLIVLMIEQRRWPLVRLKRNVWGQDSMIWKFRIFDDRDTPFGPASLLISRLRLDYLPWLISVVEGRVAVPQWGMVRNNIENLFYGPGK